MKLERVLPATQTLARLAGWSGIGPGTSAFTLPPANRTKVKGKSQVFEAPRPSRPVPTAGPDGGPSQYTLSSIG